MITEYHRPDTLEEALRLLAREEVKTMPLGGGSVLNGPSPEQYAVVDLQALGLNRIEKKGNTLLVGATATLQALLDTPDLPAALYQAIQHEATYNLRQVATLAGALVSVGGRSPLATVLLALDAQVNLLPEVEQVGTGELLLRRRESLPGRLITQIALPLNLRLAYHYVARTPADLPLVCAAAARWTSGRVRLALGGYGEAPIVALDGPEAGGVAEAARSAYFNAGDQWASAEYRREAAATLAQRCLEELS
jgi:putative selenate reductase FAD-binding subunit